MLHYKGVILHASLYICITCPFVGDTVTATIIGFPVQLSLLRLKLIEYTIFKDYTISISLHFIKVYRFYKH